MSDTNTKCDCIDSITDRDGCNNRNDSDHKALFDNKCDCKKLWLNRMLTSVIVQRDVKIRELRNFKSAVEENDNRHNEIIDVLNSIRVSQDDANEIELFKLKTSMIEVRNKNASRKKFHEKVQREQDLQEINFANAKQKVLRDRHGDE